MFNYAYLAYVNCEIAKQNEKCSDVKRTGHEKTTSHFLSGLTIHMFIGGAAVCSIESTIVLYAI